MAVKTSEERLQTLYEMALQLNAAMPSDVMLKGDGSIWVTTHGNEGIMPRKMNQKDVLELIYSVIQFGNRMISV